MQLFLNKEISTPSQISNFPGGNKSEYVHWVLNRTITVNAGCLLNVGSIQYRFYCI